jgi:hypothetical protein
LSRRSSIMQCAYTSMAKLTVTAPGWNRYSGQMSSVPPARSIRGLCGDSHMPVESQATIGQAPAVRWVSWSVWAEYKSHEDAGVQPGYRYRRRRAAETDILLDLINTFRKEEDASSQRLERVCRVSQLPRR